MAKVLLDTSVYIPLLREGRFPVFLPEFRNQLIYLSSVVLQELYAGAMDQKAVKQLDSLHYVFSKNDRLVTPSAADWRQAGLILSRMGQKYGFKKLRIPALVNDLLIALGAAHVGALLITRNQKDFKRIAEFLSFQFNTAS